MNYFERCVKRIEEAQIITCDYPTVYGLRCVIDGDLHIWEINYPPELERGIVYKIMFKGVIIPIEEESKKELLKMARFKLEELDAKRDEEILKDL
jgi:hypothetical protein